MEKKTEKSTPVIEGWFTMDLEAPHLIGTRCASCGDYFFPKTPSCRNPNCRGQDIEEVYLGRQGKLWSFTINYYQPPAPFVGPEPFSPYGICVVELPQERMMIAGQVAAGCDFGKLKIGMDMELIIEKLYADREENEFMVWKWKPLIT